MKEQLQDIIQNAVKSLDIKVDLPESIQIDRTRDKKFGDLSCNIAMVLAKQLKMNPRELAQKIVAQITLDDGLEKVEIAGPGFINFYLHAGASHHVIKQVLEAANHYGQSEFGNNKKVLLEFVSANPTGPLHVGHGRSVAFGASLADLLEAAGYKVHREYYVNDAGRQMNILAASVWLRYLELCGEQVAFPSNGYKGEYVKEIAKTLADDVALKFCYKVAEVFRDIPADAKEDGSGDKEAHIDSLIARAKQLLGQENYQKVFDLGLQIILDDIRKDLSEFGLNYQEWFSEKSLQDSGEIEKAINYLKQHDLTFEENGALWFHSMKFGDDKNRVLVRENGQTTYFASDVAYHHEKFERGYDVIIDILGADHHGYIPRLKAAIQAMGDDLNKFHIKLVQFAILYRGKERVQMSTRSGKFVTLRELRNEVGNDAARFFYVTRKSEQHMDFDLELAKSQSSENPVYYIQYAHARICRVFEQLEGKSLHWDQEVGLANLARLIEPHEIALVDDLLRYPELIEAAAKQFEPHIIAHYLRDLANNFHTYYNAHQFIVEDAALRNARLALIAAVKQVIVNGLRILGVSAPEHM